MRQLSDYEPILNQVMRVIARDTRFSCRPGLAEVLGENSRLIVALSHSSPLSWLPSASLLALHACMRGGRHRAPMGIMDNFFFHVPVMRELAHFLTQSDKPLSYAELSERFETRGDIDLVLFPEGSNCFFGEPSEIQEFRSPKFIELSIRTGAPILVGAHIGSENWGKALPVSSDVMEKLNLLPNFAFNFLEKRLKKTGLLCLPVLPLPMEKFEMLCELYRPSLKCEELSEEPEVRLSQLRKEAEGVRNKMRELLEELRSKRAAPVEVTEIGSTEN